METGTLKHVMISLKLIRIFRYILAKIPFISILKDRIKHKLGEKKIPVLEKQNPGFNRCTIQEDIL